MSTSLSTTLSGGSPMPCSCSRLPHRLARRHRLHATARHERQAYQHERDELQWPDGAFTCAVRRFHALAPLTYESGGADRDRTAEDKGEDQDVLPEVNEPRPEHAASLQHRSAEDPAEEAGHDHTHDSVGHPVVVRKTE